MTTQKLNITEKQYLTRLKRSSTAELELQILTEAVETTNESILIALVYRRIQEIKTEIAQIKKELENYEII